MFLGQDQGGVLYLHHNIIPVSCHRQGGVFNVAGDPDKQTVLHGG